uniref:CTP synthase n=1 Tax=Rhabditophanes sp. KR3021 TaxID=114890 RepID=A0AC35UG16_9BILA
MGEQEDPKIILVTGGVISGVGKEIISSSLGVLLKANGYGVSAIKINPYINIDAGTFSPFEHGEVFVLDDGGEVDLDLGNYERFLNVRLTRDNNITTGKIYQEVIQNERRGHYLGKTVQAIPHITHAISKWIDRVAKVPVDGTEQQPHVCVVELGGTVSDIEGIPFLSAFEKYAIPKMKGRVMIVHVSLIVDPKSTGEPKTKPMQNSLKKLRGNGLHPDLIICRSERPISADLKGKISGFGHVEPTQVVGVHDCKSVYQVPLLLDQQNVVQLIKTTLNLPHLSPQTRAAAIPNMAQWFKFTEIIGDFELTAKVALVGKYIKIKDAYASVNKALEHAATHAKRNLKIIYVNAEALEDTATTKERDEAWAAIKDCQAIIVPGGFGNRGIEGMINVCKYARQNKVPFLGVCLGMQCAAIEFARNVCGIEKANSSEFDSTIPFDKQVVIDMPEHVGENVEMGGTMRLGLRTTVFLTDNCKLQKLYKNDIIEERHRHRYEERDEAWAAIKDCQAIIVPGGFGNRGIEGMINVCKYARQNKVPFLGVCLGMQCAAIEFARNVCGIEKANSSEFDSTIPFDKQVVIDMPEHVGENVEMGGTMRLGLRTTVFLTDNCKLQKLYKNDIIEERHRHRYEVNPTLVPMLSEAGMLFIGMGVDESNEFNNIPRKSESAKNLIDLASAYRHSNLLQTIRELCSHGVSKRAVRMEVIELEEHPYFVGCQYHPEYLTHPITPSPPFLGLLLAASDQLKDFLSGERIPSPIKSLSINEN